MRDAAPAQRRSSLGETENVIDLTKCRPAVVGLGYVGLPLAVELGKKYPTVGFDVKPDRVAELRQGSDSTLEVEPADLEAAVQLSFTSDVAGLKQCNIYIVTVPTPIDRNKQPDLSALQAASRTVGSVLKQGDIVIYESTVYPGASEEVCVPILAAASGLEYNKDFFAGYSPERINPGDKKHRLTSICKVTSGSTPATADAVDALYASIIPAGTHKTSGIRVAEAAKVIENTQRDVNIALINELAMIFNRLGLDSQEVLEAAGTKWNFLPFRPGLVGGHCIGVDPYYLTHKAQETGYHPEMILAGRRINDNMGIYVAQQVAQLMIRRRIHVLDARILVMGLTFKENCPDIRNSRAVDVVRELAGFNARVDVFDPWIDPEDTRAAFGIEPVTDLKDSTYDAIVVAVAHDKFKAMGVDAIHALGKSKHVLYDIKQVFPREVTDGRL